MYFTVIYPFGMLLQPLRLDLQNLTLSWKMLKMAKHNLKILRVFTAQEF